MPLNKDWREFLELLNSNGAEYLVIGAFAVAFHGFPRYTGDGKMGIQAADLRSPGMVVQLGVKPNRIDLLTTISAVSFEEAWATRCQAELEGVATHFIGRAALLRNKEQTGRAKDLGDAEELRKRTPGPFRSQTD